MTVAWFPVPGAQSYKVFYIERNAGNDMVFTSYPPPITNNPSTLIAPSSGDPLFTGQSNVVTTSSIVIQPTPRGAGNRIAAMVYAYTDTVGKSRLTNFPTTCLTGNKGAGALYLEKTMYTFSAGGSTPFYITETGVNASQSFGYQGNAESGVINIDFKALV